MSKQLEIPMPETNHARGAESDRVYAAVITLRKRGHRVTRGGGLYHVVDGRRFRYDQVIEMAEMPEPEQQ